MPANPIDTKMYRKVMDLRIDGQNPRRFSQVAARREHYKASRMERYSRYLNGLSK